MSDDGDNRARQRQDFDRDIDVIRSGAHLGWLKHLAFIYFAMYSDTDRNCRHAIVSRRGLAKNA